MKQILIFMLLIVITLTPFSGAVAHGEEVYLSLEEELADFEIDGVLFDFDDYPADEADTDIYILTFIEYNFPSTADNPVKYYLYIYNPSGIELSKEKGSQNYIYIATDYDDKNHPIEFNAARLVYLSNTRNELFYKYKLTYVLPEAKSLDEIKLKYNLTELLRRYDLRDMYFTTASGDNMVISRDSYLTYTYSGYRAGWYSEECDLSCTVTESTSYTTNAYDTFYRDSWGNGFYPELDTLYFSVDNDILDNYYAYAYDVSYYEYYTAPILYLGSVFDTLEMKMFELYSNFNQMYVDNWVAENTLGIYGGKIQVEDNMSNYDWVYNINTIEHVHMFEGPPLYTIDHTRYRIADFAFVFEQNSEYLTDCYVSKDILKHQWFSASLFVDPFHDMVKNINQWHDNYKWYTETGNGWSLLESSNNPYLINDGTVCNIERKNRLSNSYYEERYVELDDIFSYVINGNETDDLFFYYGMYNKEYKSMGAYTKFFGASASEIKLFDVFRDDNIDNLFIDSNEQNKVIEFNDDSITHEKSTILFRLGFSDYYNDKNIGAVRYVYDELSESTIEYDLGLGGAALCCETLYYEPEITLYFKKDIEYVGVEVDFTVIADSEFNYFRLISILFGLLFLIIVIIVISKLINVSKSRMKKRARR